MAVLPDLKQVNRTKPWWNRPLIGHKSMLERLLAFRQSFHKEVVPDNALRLYRRHFSNIEALLVRANSIDREKFGNQEFLAFVRMKRDLALEHSGYKDLDRFVDLLMAGINAKASFLGIEAIEFEHQSSKQQRFYQSIASLYSAHLSPMQFIDLVQQQYTEILPQLRTNEGRTALQSYFKYLRVVANHPLSFRLLCRFKQYQFTDFSILKVISEMIDRLQRVDLLDRAYLKAEVIDNYEVFEKMGQVIGLPAHLHNTQSYGILLQYVALSEKYKQAYPQFQQLVVLLEQWYESYLAIRELKAEYVNRKYRYPKIFKQTTPGIGLYRKYKDYFTQ